MRAHLGLVLFVCVMTGCTSVRTLQLAEATGKGNVDASLELGAERLRTNTGFFLPTGDIALRYGLSERTDLTTRFGGSGFELGLKREVRTEALRHFVFAGDVRARVNPLLLSSAFLARAEVGAIAQWSPLSVLHVIASPRLIAATTPTTSTSYMLGGERVQIESSSLHLALIPAATFGVAVDLHPSIRLITEAGVTLRPIFDTDVRSEAALSTTGSMALQWRPRDFPSSNR